MQNSVKAILVIVLTAGAFAIWPAHTQTPAMSFFLTSDGPGDGGNLGGLAGADGHCEFLAAAVGAGGKTWRAYLSTQPVGGTPAVSARDRIGAGPWHNANGAEIAANVDALHSEPNNINKATALNEHGRTVNGRGDSPNRHDILTGTQEDGTAFAAGDDMTCGNWTSNGMGAAMVGHHDLTGNRRGPNFWNVSHASRGCSQSDLARSGGDGLFYCFALNEG